MNADDRETAARALRLCELTHEMLSRMTLPERDRVMQQHLAQAATPAQKARALCAMTAFLLDARRGNPAGGGHDEA